MLDRLRVWLVGTPAALGTLCNCVACIQCNNGHHEDCPLQCRVHPALVVI